MTWHNHEQILARFGEWLEEAQAEADTLAEQGEPAAADPEVRAVGLYQLVEEFTSLRHELKLQTKGSRALEERGAAVIDALQGAIDQFRSVEAKETQAAHKALRPMVEALVELDEALERGRIVIETARRRMVEQAVAELGDRLEERFLRQSWWQRLLHRRWHEAVKALCLQHDVQSRQHIFDALLEGYGLTQTRLRRLLSEEQIVRMQCLGEQADPNRMAVVEVLDRPGRPAAQVIEEVRPGYYWKGKVLRFAEVKAVAEAGPSAGHPTVCKPL